jgi:hypothetical protein
MPKRAIISAPRRSKKVLVNAPFVRVLSTLSKSVPRAELYVPAGRLNVYLSPRDVLYAVYAAAVGFVVADQIEQRHPPSEDIPREKRSRPVAVDEVEHVEEIGGELQRLDHPWWGGLW